MKPIIHINKSHILIDEQVEIHVSGLLSNEVITVKATMCDNYGNNWESYAQLKANQQGEIDLATAKPVSGTYEEPDINGLFWSMKRLPNETTQKRTPLKPLETIFVLEKDDRELARSSITRQITSSHVERQSVREKELVGTLFYDPEKDALPTVIVLGGSEGGLQEGTAALLASYGFNTLALAYFGIEHLPSELVHIPVDYIEKAVHWLIEHPNVDDTNLGVMGTSKGGELALLSASMFSELKAVVGYVPSSVVFPGIGFEMDKSSWTYKDKEIPFASGEVPDEVMAEIQNDIATGYAPIRYRDWYDHTAKEETEAEIQVENIVGSVLLISGGDDQLWPADVFSEKVIHRLQRNNHPYSYGHANYPYAGHAFGIPGYPTTESTETPFFQDRKILLGGNPKENANAERDAWEKVKAFFLEHLTD